MGTRQKLLSNRAFVTFWTARVVSFTGSGVTTVVLPLLVYRLVDSPAAVAALNVLDVSPYIAFGLIAGAVAERLNRKKIMLICNGASALMLGTVPAASALHLLVIAQVFVVAFGIGMSFVWFDAANFGSLPALVDRSQLPEASSLVASGGALALICGPTIGGALLGIMAPSYALGFDATSYVISGLLIFSIRRPFRRPQQQAEPSKRLRADVAEGLRYLWHHSVIRTMTVSVFCSCLSWGGTVSLLVVYASRALHLAHADLRLGLLYSAGQLGGFIAVAAVPLLIRRVPAGRMLAAVLAASAVVLALLSAAPSYIWAVVLFCCYELVYIMINAMAVTIRQMILPDNFQARVNTAARLFGYAGQPVGAIVSGLLAEFISIRLTYALLAVAVAVGACLAGWNCVGSRPLAKVSLSAPAPAPDELPLAAAIDAAEGA
jgi:MFS family permease